MDRFFDNRYRKSEPVKKIAHKYQQPGGVSHQVAG